MSSGEVTQCVHTMDCLLVVYFASFGVSPVIQDLVVKKRSFKMVCRRSYFSLYWTCTGLFYLRYAYTSVTG
jgi:hypothetical protein